MLILLSSVPLRAADRTPFELTTLLGETYHGCRILKVTPEAMTIVYDNGVSKVPFELLGDAWKELYHYDPDKAHEFAEHEEAKRQAAEERRREELKALDKQKNQQMTELLKSEHQRDEFEARLAKDQADAAAKATATPASPSNSRLSRAMGPCRKVHRLARSILRAKPPSSPMALPILQPTTWVIPAVIPLATRPATSSPTGHACP